MKVSIFISHYHQSIIISTIRVLDSIIRVLDSLGVGECGLLINPIRNESSSLKSVVWKICILAKTVYSPSQPLHDQKKESAEPHTIHLSGGYLLLDSNMVLGPAITSKDSICLKP